MLLPDSFASKHFRVIIFSVTRPVRPWDVSCVPTIHLIACPLYFVFADLTTLPTGKADRDFAIGFSLHFFPEQVEEQVVDLADQVITVAVFGVAGPGIIRLKDRVEVDTAFVYQVAELRDLPPDPVLALTAYLPDDLSAVRQVGPKAQEVDSLG